MLLAFIFIQSLGVAALGTVSFFFVRSELANDYVAKTKVKLSEWHTRLIEQQKQVDDYQATLTSFHASLVTTRKELDQERESLLTESASIKKLSAELLEKSNQIAAAELSPPAPGKPDPTDLH